MAIKRIAPGSFCPADAAILEFSPAAPGKRTLAPPLPWPLSPSEPLVPPPGEKLVRRHATPAVDEADRDARNARLRQHLQLLRDRPPATPLRPGLDLSLRIGTSHRHDITPNPYFEGETSQGNREGARHYHRWIRMEHQTFRDEEIAREPGLEKGPATTKSAAGP